MTDRAQWEDCKVCGGDHWTKDHPVAGDQPEGEDDPFFAHAVPRPPPDTGRRLTGEAMSENDSPDQRTLSHCWQFNGWHAYMAGPCFDTIEQAQEYRDALTDRGVSWWPSDKPLPPLDSPEKP